MPRAMEAQQYCTFNYNEHLCVLQTRAVSPAIICQLLVWGQRCSIWRDHSFTLRAFALAKDEEKTVRKAANTSLKLAFIENFCYWYSSVPEYWLIPSFSVFLLNYESIFASRDLLQRTFNGFLLRLSFVLSSFHLLLCDRHTREGGKALIWLLFAFRSWGYAGFWSVARLLESEL